MNMETLKKCKQCGKELDASHVTFCSRSCFKEYYEKQRERKSITHCKNCGSVLTKTKVFCSRKCVNDYRRNYADIHWHGIKLTSSNSEKTSKREVIVGYVQ